MGQRLALRDKVNVTILMIGLVSTFAVSVPKAAANPPSFTTMFEDNFDGSSVDTVKWNTSVETSGKRWCSDTVELHHSNPGNWLDPEREACHGLFQSSPFGSVSVDGGIASFSASPLRTFPYIWRGPPSNTSPFPATGDFILEVRMKFDQVTPYGDGLAVVPWTNSDPVGNNPPIPQAYEGMILLIWPDAGGLSVRTVGNTFRLLPGALDYHLYRLENVGGLFSLFVDDLLVAGPIFSNIRPYTIWIGNPVFVHWEVLDWSDFSVDYVRVSVPATSIVAFSDNFNDNVRDSSVWTSFTVGSGTMVEETNQRLEITLPSTSSDDPSLHVFGAGYTSVCQLRGDFDIQTDFQLLVWPFANGVRLGMGGPEATFLTATPTNSAVERVSFGDFSADYAGQSREVYLTHFNDGVQGITPTGDLLGKLRLVRSGSTLTGYYFSTSNWIAIHSGPTVVKDFHVNLVSWSHDYAFTNQFVRIAFDNFIVNQGLQVCPAGISVSKFFTDSGLSPLPIDNIGNPKIDVVLADGIVRSTNPGQLLAWVNVTNTAGDPLQSLRVDETLPVDWSVNPPWTPAAGAIHIFFVFTDGTQMEITDSADISVSSGNPQTVSIAMADISDTIAGKPIGLGESILLSVKIDYVLAGTSQSARTYPRNYTDTARAEAWADANFSGSAVAGNVSAFFVAFARVVGDADGDLDIDLDDVILVWQHQFKSSFQHDMDVDGDVDLDDLLITWHLQFTTLR